MRLHPSITCTARVFTLFALLAAAAHADTLVLATSSGAQGASDTVKWGQLGPNATSLGASFSSTSAGGLSVTGNLSAAGALVTVVCSATPCSWSPTGSGFAGGDSLIWTSDTGNGGTGPLTLTFNQSVSGAGAFIQADNPGPFTAQIQAYNGTTLLGTFTQDSDSAGDPVYIGVLDQTGANITSVTFSLTACAAICTDFGIDSASLTTPYPAIFSLSPSSALVGGAGFTLTINGANFAAGATAKWGTTALTTTFVSAHQLTAAVPAALISSTGTASVTVTTALGTSPPATFTINPSQQPAVVSLTPNPAIGLPVVFTASYSDPDGAANINQAWLLVNSAIASSSACFVYYSPQNNAFYLRNDQGTAWLLPGVAPGGGAVANSQCTLNGSSTTVNASGNTLTLHLSLTFSSAFVGARNVYLYASSLGGLNTGWVKSGTWAPTAQPAPTISSLNPSSANAGSAPFTLTINGTNFTSIATAKWGSTALTTTYISASQMTAAIPASLIASVGTPSVTVTTTGGTSAGSTFTINPSQPPSVVSLSPNPANGLPVIFTATYSDPEGATDINQAWMLVNTTNSGSAACFVYYHPQANQLFLRNDSGSAWLTPGLTPGGSGTLANSQCTLNAATSSANETGNNLTVQASITFANTFLGIRNVYLYASGLTGLNSGWVNKGTWNPSTVPSITNLNPNSAMAGGAAFTLTINGTNFVSGAAAQWGTTALTTTFVNAGQLTAAVPSGLIASAGTASVTVTTSGGTSPGSTFTINPLPPVISSLSPASINAFSAAFTLTVNGSNFVSGAVAKWGTTSLTTTFVNAGQVTAAVPASLIAAAGTPSVTVTTPSGTSAGSTFTINPAQPPAVYLLTPNSGSGPSVIMAAVYSDPQGAAEINQAWLLINTGLTAGNACYVYYHPQANLLYLRNDAGTAWLSPGLAPGNPGTVSNSQCTLNGNSSSVGYSGNYLTVAFSLTFNPAFVGARNVYMFASGLSALNSGWVKSGTWTPN
jgi:hypothetical protein